MPETKQTVTLPKPPQVNQHNETGVVKIVGDSQIPREYITAGWDLDEAAVRSFLADDNEVNNVTRLYDKLKKFNVTRGMETLRFWLNARRAVGGKANVYALMGHTGIIAPEALGIKLSRKDTEDLKELQRERDRRRQNEDHRPG